MKTAEEIRFRVAATVLNLKLTGFKENTPLDGAHYALRGLLAWIDADA